MPMSEPERKGLSKFDWSIRLDALCDRFESQWINNGRPILGELLAEVSEDERVELFEHLLSLELEYRRRLDERPVAEHYLTEYPKYKPQIEKVFRESEKKDAGVGCVNAKTRNPHGGSPDGQHFFDPPSPPLNQGGISPLLPEEPLGPYKILSTLGEGGFGIVYLAQQEKPFNRRVALKIIKVGMDTRQVLARFDAERQALAVMDHPNIAKIYDAGATTSGRSYFVMELVHGEPITDYCDRHKLSLEKRLELFVPVCHAVQHAHQKGIIHRDLKPSNVLVTVVADQPVPKIIDFGVAKAMAQPLTPQTVYTEQGQLIGTLEYMSPEQVEMSNLDIDTRSDIYSLGVLLYELLTGTLPFDRKTLRQAGFDEIRRIIREEEPPKPSTKISTLGSDSQDLAVKRHTDPRALHRHLRQELDWIVMKTLEKDRTRRYATAMALAEDVRRYLAQEPVQAGPPGSWYQLRRYARRYKTPLSIAGGFMVLLLLITVLAIRGYYREESLRREAEQNAKRANVNFKLASDVVKKYYTKVANDPLLKPHNLEMLRRDLLESANEFYEDLIRQDADSPDLQHERVKAFAARGDIEDALGNCSEAETAYRKAIAVATRLVQNNDTEPEYENELACGYGNLGVIYQKSGRAKDAEAVSRQALAILKNLVQKNPEVSEYQSSLALYQNNLGAIYQNTGRPNEAESTFKDALLIRKSMAEEHPETREYQYELADGHNNLGLFYQEIGKTEEAEAALKEAISVQNILLEKHPEMPEYQSGSAESHNNLAIIYRATGRTKDAEESYKKSLSARTILAEKHPDVPEYQNDLAISFVNLGNLLQTTHRAQDAEACYTNALAVQKKLVMEHPTIPEYQKVLVGCQDRLGKLYELLDRKEAAEAAFREALVIMRALVDQHPEVPDYQADLVDSNCSLGVHYKTTNRMDEAESALKDALAVSRHLVEKYPETPRYGNALWRSYNNLGNLYQIVGNIKEAETAFKEALTVQRKLLAKHPDTLDFHNNLATSHYNLGNLYRATGRVKDAEACYKEAVAVRLVLVEKYPEMPEYQNALASIYCNLGILNKTTGQVQQAELNYKEALAIWKTLAERRPDISEFEVGLANSYLNLGGLLSEQNRAKEAEDAYKEAVAVQQRLVTKCPESPAYQLGLAACCYNLSTLYETTDRLTDAEKACDETHAILLNLAKKYPKIPEYRFRFATSCYKLSGICKAKGQVEEAEATYKEAITNLKDLVEKQPDTLEYHDALAVGHNNLGDLYQIAGRAEEAEAAFQEALSIQETLVEKHPEMPKYRDGLAIYRHNLANLYQTIGSCKEAEEAYKEALRIRRNLAGKYPNVPEYQKKLAALEKRDALAERYQGKKVAQNSAAASWSPDSGKLAVGKMPYGDGIQIVNLQTEEIVKLLGFGKDPAWSPGEGRWIAFVRSDNSAQEEEVWVVEPFGSNLRKIAEGGFPSWSADGKKLFYLSRKQRKVFATQPGNPESAVTEVCEMPYSCPTISPSGDQIGCIKGNSLVILDRVTKTEFAYPQPVEGLSCHSWSPDGKQIAMGFFSEDSGSDYGFGIFDLSTRNFKRIAAGHYTKPVWSPDGSKIAVDFRSDNGYEDYEIWIIDRKNFDTEK
jgi:eukaryotic-like serine/threonine-protein kinase